MTSMKDTDSERDGTDRRTVLKSIGAVAAVGAAGAYSTRVTAQESQQSRPYSIVQGDKCVPVAPLSVDDMTVEQFYGYTTNENGKKEPYEANTPGNIGLPDTSYIFLYEGPKGLSLVFVHGGGQKKQGGAISFDITGLPQDGKWVVQSDGYKKDPDQWNVQQGRTQVDWSWNKYHDDGGAFRGLGSNFEITIKPSFNQAAKLKPEDPGTVKHWQVVNDGPDGRTPTDLQLDQPITIRSRPCE